MELNKRGNIDIKNFPENTINEIRDKVGDRRVLCALSGGVDSSVCALLAHKAVGQQLVSVFVDSGLMRKNEGDEIEAMFKDKFGLNFIRVNAQDRFLDKLKGIIDPEKKRMIIGEEFIRIFEEEAKKIGEVDFLVQGTIYPDIIESDKTKFVKSHHNVGGLPDVIKFREIIEPIRLLYKQEVRAVGRSIGLPDDLVDRQPFPGPGLAVRVLGEVTKEKLDVVRESGYIFNEEIKKAGLDKKIWQYFTVLTGLRSVGMKNGIRTYGYTVALRAVHSVDAMTADFAEIPYDVLRKTSERIVNEVADVNRIVYDITTKPPSTIEWE